MHQNPARSRWLNVRNTALTVLVAGGGQILLALVLWPILYRRYPLGFSLALSLVGFGNWIVAGIASLGLRGRAGSGFRMRSASPALENDGASVLTQMQAQVERAGCGFVLFLSSFVPLALAFVLRVRADLQSGLTWQDLFPPPP